MAARVRDWSGGRTFTVQTQDPRWRNSAYDLIVAPAHDGLSGDNVFEIIGSPHRITRQKLAEAAPAFADRIDVLPHPRVAVMIGGRSRAFDLTPAHAAILADRIKAAVQAAGGSLLLTFSRRTPDAAQAVMTERLSDLPGWIWDGTGDNPLFAMLDGADHVLVTEDSANMATEAAATGKPVHILPMIALKPPGKFARLHADLQARGAARPFDRLDLRAAERDGTRRPRRAGSHGDALVAAPAASVAAPCIGGTVRVAGAGGAAVGDRNRIPAVLALRLGLGRHARETHERDAQTRSDGHAQRQPQRQIACRRAQGPAEGDPQTHADRQEGDVRALLHLHSPRSKPHPSIAHRGISA